MAGRQSTFQAIIATLVITRRAGPRFGHGRFRTVAAGQAIITTLVISRRARAYFGQGRSGAARRWRAIITALVIARRTRSVFLHRHLGENGLCCQHPDCPKHDTATNKKHKKKTPWRMILQSIVAASEHLATPPREPIHANPKEGDIMQRRINAR